MACLAVAAACTTPAAAEVASLQTDRGATRKQLSLWAVVSCRRRTPNASLTPGWTAWLDEGVT
eukprot:364876-Chlamydomonas_euryale.AAC.5